MRSRSSLVATAVVVLAMAAIGAAIVMAQGPKSGGPISASLHESWEDHFPAPAGQVWTWGIILPENVTSDPLVIESVELESVANVKIGGVLADDPMRSGGIGIVPGFPAPDHAGAPATSYTVAANGAAGSILQLQVAVTKAEPGVGTIGGLRIRYRSQGGLYEDRLPISLRIVQPDE